MKDVNCQSVFGELEKGIAFNNQINLYDTVENNENFYIGKQWEGVQSNGLPTPVFNFIKRVVMYLVASTSTDNLKISASPLSSAGIPSKREVEDLCRVVNAQFEALFEQNKVAKRIRDFMRNAAVDGDGCIYTWFDPTVETGQAAKGVIRMELLENTRVIFGNPNCREVQEQPYILVVRRMELDKVKRRAKAFGGDPEDTFKPDTDENNDRFDAMTDGKATVVTRLWLDPERKTLWGIECTRDGVVRPQWETGQTLYPIVWLPWDYVQNCYHGQAAVTGLIPNQIFVNKAYAMSMISLMTKNAYERGMLGNIQQIFQTLANVIINSVFIAMLTMFTDNAENIYTQRAFTITMIIISFAMVILSLICFFFTKERVKDEASSAENGGTQASKSSATNPVKAFNALKGIGLGMSGGMAMGMVADTITYSRLKSGIDPVGMGNAAMSASQKLGLGLGTAVLGWVMDAAGFDPLLDAQGIAQPESVVTAIRFLYNWLPVILCAIVLVALLVLYDIEKKLPQMEQ